MGLSLYVTRPEHVASITYSGFNAFRERLAGAVGLDLAKMAGYVEDGPGQPWPPTDSEPLVHLFNHSDCDGALTTEQCREIAPRLRTVVKAWPEEDFDREFGEQLAEAMEEAGEHYGEVLFR